MKKFFITLGLSVVVWFISIIIQGVTLNNVKFSLFSGSACEITGFPIATCIYGKNITSLGIQLFNIFFWFWVIHLFWKWFGKRKLSS